jgi:hypothetical protein
MAMPQQEACHAVGVKTGSENSPEGPLLKAEQKATLMR